MSKRNYFMNTIRHWKEILEYWDREFESYSSIYSIILYSPMDKNLIKFFSDNDCWAYLDQLSTNKCLNFIIAETKPGFPTWYEVPHNENLSPPEFSMTADAFGIDNDQIPCLIFFRDIESRLEERVVCEIERDANIDELRKIFDELYNKIERVDYIKDKEERKKQRGITFSNFRKNYRGKKVGNMFSKKVKKFTKWVGEKTIAAVISELFDRLGIKDSN